MSQTYGIAFSSNIDTSSQKLINKIDCDTVESYRRNHTERSNRKSSEDFKYDNYDYICLADNQVKRLYILIYLNKIYIKSI